MRTFDFLAHAVRAKEIFSVLARYGFANLLQQAEAPTGMWRRILPEPAEKRTTEERLRMAAEELGPTFVKFGQLLSMRPEILPQSYILELGKLQNSVQALPFSDMLPVLEQALGKPYTEVFEDFETQPAASASLAQVYKARIRGTGDVVAVKVQKPGITRTIEIDLDLAGWVASQLHQRSHELRPFDLPAVVEEVRSAIIEELDFRLEANNQDYFNVVNPHPEQVFAPKVYKELSSERVMVSAWVEGTSPAKSLLPREQLKEIAGNGAKSLMHQILVDGFFHADPHAGNVVITLDGRLAFIDWGMVGNLTRRLRHALGDFLVAAMDQDAERLVRIATELAPSEARLNQRLLEQRVLVVLRQDLNFTTGRLQMGRAMLRLLYVLGKNGIPLSRDFSIMAKAVLSFEEIGWILDPDFDLKTFATPLVRQQQRDGWSPNSILRTLAATARSTLLGLRDIPTEINRLMRRLEHDNLTVNFQHRGLEPLQDTVKAAANRIALGVIVGSLVVGSSLIVTTGAGPRLFGYPALGIVGYLISAVIGLAIIYDIVRYGRHK